MADGCCSAFIESTKSPQLCVVESVSVPLNQALYSQSAFTAWLVVCFNFVAILQYKSSDKI